MARGQFGVNRICQLTGISKATYYAAKNPIVRFEQKYLNIKSTISKIIEDNPCYGILRIKKELLEAHDVAIGKETLGKLLVLWGLSLKRKVKKPKINMIHKILLALADRANLLIRTKITAPFQALSSDITELYFKGGRVYLCVHKDVYGQMVYGWSLGLKQDKQLVLASLKRAQQTIKQLLGKLAKKIKPIMHQDRGSQYTSYAYTQQALNWTTLSYSSPGTPTHNPGQESFFGRFKSEWQDEIAEIETFEDLEKFVKQKINYYNNERRHTSIGLVSPRNFTKSFLKNKEKWFS